MLDLNALCIEKQAYAQFNYCLLYKEKAKLMNIGGHQHDQLTVNVD